MFRMSPTVAEADAFLAKSGFVDMEVLSVL